MGDLVHEKVPTEFIEKVFYTIQKARWHIFQLLTKRADRLENLSLKLTWPQNLWMGVTVESQEYVSRIEKLRNVPASIKFISFEPLLGPIKYSNLRKIDWVIVGGESGPYARTMSADWVRMIRNACVEHSIPFFFKQWGGNRRKKLGRMLDQKIWNQYPSSSAITS
jgi:protein gp37